MGSACVHGWIIVAIIIKTDIDLNISDLRVSCHGLFKIESR